MDSEKIALDFDGVVNQDHNGRSMALMPGAKEAIIRLSESGYEVYILTARREQMHDVISAWLFKETGLHLRVTNFKERATVYVDDRGLRFTNWPDVMEQLKRIL